MTLRRAPDGFADGRARAGPASQALRGARLDAHEVPAKPLLHMSSLPDLLESLVPLRDVISRMDPADPEAARKLEAALPLDAPAMQRVAALVREGVEAGWLCDRENDGIRFSRVYKASAVDDLGVDAVHMSKPGPGHTHPNGEFDLCFAVAGEPRFDGRPAGWTVYPPGSWHIPTVSGGTMDILYFLPGGAIRFEPEPQ